MILPLSLSYDHRVIDGADGARFIVDLANRLNDIERN
jgi:pyruvate dehydrogenase E2 component (dihydrolipoamide acetyltransferase)